MQITENSEEPEPRGASCRTRYGDTYSFILRLQLETPSTSTPPRPVFKLEDVSAGRKWRFTSFDKAVSTLASRIHQIIGRSESS